MILKNLSQYHFKLFTHYKKYCSELEMLLRVSNENSNYDNFKLDDAKLSDERNPNFLIYFK